MEYVRLGSTELSVSVAGLGCGGSSRLGTVTGNSKKDSINIVKRALELGVNFFDTAKAYGTEEIVGEALQGTKRDDVIISTKSLVRRGGKFFSAHEFQSGLESSLSSLKMDYIDIFHLHAVLADDYWRVKDELVPVLLRAKEDGKIRHLGITESPPNDYGHSLLEQVFKENCPFEVIMFGFHLMHQNARSSVFPATAREDIGTLIMFAVRSIFSDAHYLASKLKELSDNGLLPGIYNEIAIFQELLIGKGGAESIIDAAYRYARHEPGANVVLLGTGNLEHLETNIKSILRPPLKESALKILAKDFSQLEGVGLDLPRDYRER